MRVWIHVIAMVAMFITSPASAAIDSADIPEVLRPWVPWVLKGQEELLCPSAFGAWSHQCVWPARLTLQLDDHGGRWKQQWTVFREDWVQVPGDDQVWPRNVRLDGQPAVVTERDGMPHVRMAPGSHEVNAELVWNKLPEQLQLPPATALIDLTVRGNGVTFPNRDSNGKLWLEQPVTSVTEADRLEVVVHRLIDDDAPLLLTTSIDLRVGGAGREVLLGRALPEGFRPLHLTSALPARIEPDGRLRVQLRPGDWNLLLVARHDEPVTELTLTKDTEPWDDEEVWSFAAHPPLRLVAVEGVLAVDPEQTELPTDWRQYPAYRMRPGDTLKLVEKQRGNDNPAPDRLTLRRTWWLDFDGGGYSVHDTIGGTASRSWRLEMMPPALVGRLAVDGENTFITRIEGAAGTGAELRQGTVRLDADSRGTGVSDLPAVSWDQDFQQVDGTLNLPPGWRLIHASGADETTPTWISDWSLLDLFLVLITALAFSRLWGWLYGALALVALALTYTEPGAPGGIWLALLAVEALMRVLPTGRLRRIAVALRVVALAVLVWITLPFLVEQLRYALYPSLQAEPTAVEGGVRARQDLDLAQSASPLAGLRAQDGSDAYAQFKKSVVVDDEKADYSNRIDPTAAIQTGPGMPVWNGEVVTVSWRGPVERNQRLHLMLLSPWLNYGVTCLRVVLLFSLVILVFAATVGTRALRRGLAGGTALLLIAIATSSAQAQFPSPELLSELRQRLLEPPDCDLNCSSSSTLELEITRTALRARWSVDVAVAGAIPLLGKIDQWLPTSVLVDERLALVLRLNDGQLWLQLPAGRHDLRLEGALPDRDQVQIELPLKPHHVASRADGWQVDGVDESGRPAASLQLTRIRDAGDSASASLQPGTLPSFARVTRKLDLGLTWKVHTVVQRISASGTAIVMEVPLLPGESLTGAEPRVVDQKAVVNIPPQAQTLEWDSILPQTETLVLRATESPSYAETWELDASPIWHVETEGAVEVQPAPDTEHRVRTWQPWPRESVTIHATRPAGVPGQTLTIDKSLVNITPGLRAMDIELNLTIRSSRGAQHVIRLPNGAELQSASIDGRIEPIRQEQQSVTVPLTPGQREVQLVWRQPTGIAIRFESPAINLNTPSVNAETVVAMPANRWTLFLGGPSFGPAVLFWSLLAVFLATSLVLGQVRLTPLRWHQWFLLGIGLTQVPVWMAMIVVGWLFALGWRARNSMSLTPWAFDAVQILLVLATIAALVCLMSAIEQGLLGVPEMQIAGNGSYATLLRWYQDRAPEELPRVWVISLPLMVYRFAMLAWALWLAQAVLSWLRWGWEAFSSGEMWRSPFARKTI